MDSQGGMWLGTYFGGLNYYHPIRNRFKNIRNIPYKNSLSDNVVSCIVEDKDKNLWFTTVGQGIFKYNTITNHLEQYEFKNANGLMASVLVDSENQIWAITNWGNSGLFKLNKAENKFEDFSALL